MAILWLNLAIVFMISLSARYFSNTSVNPIGTITVIKPNKFLVFAALVSLVTVSGLRRNIGDTFFYMYAFENNDITWEYVQSQKDIGFGILQMLLQQISQNPQILVFTTALITNLLIIIVLYKYSRLFELAAYVYITGGMFLVSMNGIRQVLAAAIIFTATKFLIEGNWFKYTLVVVLASFFHQSALILIPIYFMARFKAWSKATYLLILFSVVIVIGFDQFSALLFSAIEGTQYGEYGNFNEGGSSFIRVLVDGAPLVIAYLGRDRLREIFPKSDYIVNMSIIGIVFMIISTQNWIFARFAIYFSLYQIILISWIVKVFKEKDQKFIYYGIIICYFLYFFYENVLTLGIEYRSDYIEWGS